MPYSAEGADATINDEGALGTAFTRELQVVCPAVRRVRMRK